MIPGNMRVSQVLEFLFRGLQFLDEQKTHASSKGLWEGLAFYLIPWSRMYADTSSWLRSLTVQMKYERLQR